MRYKKSGIKRKCGCCGQDFYISNENIEEAIYYDKKTYHSRCFLDMCSKRSKMKRSDVAQKWLWILENIDSVKRDSYKHLNIAVIKDNVFEFIKSAYDVTIIPTTVWHKIGNIYNGTFKGMSEGIPPEHLLDMWQRKIDMLNGIANRNVTMGKKMSGEQRINYDLSILINKYDSYLKWLDKQKILEVEKETEKNENIVGKTIGYANEHKQVKHSDDISDLVDDIFG